MKDHNGRRGAILRAFSNLQNVSTPGSAACDIEEWFNFCSIAKNRFHCVSNFYDNLCATNIVFAFFFLRHHILSGIQLRV